MSTTLFGWRLDELLGEKLADICLWKEKLLTAGILSAFTVVWILFEVVELNFIALLSYILILLFVILFIWSKAAGLIKTDPPSIDDIRLPESAINFLSEQIDQLLETLYNAATGDDIKDFLVGLVCLWILSVFGSHCTVLSFLYVGFICMATLPMLCELFRQGRLDNFIPINNDDIGNFFSKFSSIFDKIPKFRKDKDEDVDGDQDEDEEHLD